MGIQVEITREKPHQNSATPGLNCVNCCLLDVSRRRKTCCHWPPFSHARTAAWQLTGDTVVAVGHSSTPEKRIKARCHWPAKMGETLGWAPDFGLEHMGKVWESDDQLVDLRCFHHGTHMIWTDSASLLTRTDGSVVADAIRFYCFPKHCAKHAQGLLPLTARFAGTDYSVVCY